MDVLRIAARVAAGLSQPLSDRPDYGTREMVSQEQDELSPEGTLGQECLSQQEQEGVVRKTPGKGYCVKSEDNPDWSGGCYPSKGEAKERLQDVEYFKHKGSVEAVLVATDAFIASPSPSGLEAVLAALHLAERALDK